MNTCAPWKNPRNRIAYAVTCTPTVGGHPEQISPPAGYVWVDLFIQMGANTSISFLPGIVGASSAQPPKTLTAGGLAFQGQMFTQFTAGFSGFGTTNVADFRDTPIQAIRVFSSSGATDPTHISGTLVPIWCLE